ncbi:MAG: AAA family ATPase [Rhodoferax sp.]|nr:AAA family ATPase [Rhodoferax sp.]
MKIANPTIQGFRPLRKFSWSPSRLNIMIGPNGTGKSNLLRCLELISISAQGKLGKHIQSLFWHDSALVPFAAVSFGIFLDFF